MGLSGGNNAKKGLANNFKISKWNILQVQPYDYNCHYWVGFSCVSESWWCWNQRPPLLTDNSVPSARLYSKVTPRVKSISRVRKLLTSLTWNAFPSCLRVIFKLSWAASFLFTMLIPMNRHTDDIQDSQTIRGSLSGFSHLTCMGYAFSCVFAEQVK